MPAQRIGPGKVVKFNTVTNQTTQSSVISLGYQRDAAARGRDEVTVQVDATGDASVDIQVRLDSTLAWQDVETGITAPGGVYRIGMGLEIRLDVTATVGTATGAVMF